MDDVLAAGRLAARLLEATPLDGHGYSEDEIAAQYAAVDRLLAAFRWLEKEVKTMSQYTAEDRERWRAEIRAAKVTMTKEEFQQWLVRRMNSAK